LHTQKLEEKLLEESNLKKLNVKQSQGDKGDEDQFEGG
jgi:hypothetical protein